MAGKGDKPRNNLSSEFRKNYDEINWSKKTRANKRKGKGKQCQK